MDWIEFNNSIRQIEANRTDFFTNEKNIYNYYSLTLDRSTEKHIITFADNLNLPNDIKKQIQEAFEKFLT